MPRTIFPDKERIKKYLAYSLGEIFLVVVGILIAVQINNCNENNKSRKNEVFILNEILNNLDQDEQQLKVILSQREKTQASIERMAVYLNNPKEINVDTFGYDLAQLLTFERYFPIRTSYEVAKVSGLKISDKKLRSGIANYYEFEQNRLQTSLKDIEKAFFEEFPTINTNHYAIESYGRRVQLTDYQNPVFIRSVQGVLSYFVPNHSGTLLKVREFVAVNQAISDKIGSALTQTQQKH